jgi:glucan phosphorylase
MKLIEKMALADSGVSRKGEGAARRKRRRPFEEEMQIAGSRRAAGYKINRARKCTMEISAYVQAQERLGALYRDPRGWDGKAVLKVSGSGKCSSGRTSAEYASGIWG